MVLTERQKKILTKIVNDKYSVGAFSGMIFNAVLAHPDLTIEEHLQKALEVREVMEDNATKVVLPKVVIHKK